MKKIAFTVLIISLTACNTQKAINADYEINKNETFEISLKSNPTTGYSWKWIKNQSSKVLDSVNATFIPTKVAEGIVGSGGIEIWKFKGIETGSRTFNFIGESACKKRRERICDQQLK